MPFIGMWRSPDAEIGRQDVRLTPHLLDRALEDDAALIDDADPVRDLDGDIRILLDTQDADLLPLPLLQRLHDGIDDNRGEPLRRIVAQQEGRKSVVWGKR